jgi:hypothetical protein
MNVCFVFFFCGKGPWCVCVCKSEIDYVQDLFQTLSMHDSITILYNLGE